MAQSNTLGRNHRSAAATQTPFNDVRALGLIAGRTVAVATVTGIAAVGLGTSASATPAAPRLTSSVTATAPAAPIAGLPTVHLGTTTLELGSRGTYVRALQSTLTSKGVYVYVDGDFGAKTRSAVMQYQRSVGLNVDGIVGPTTKATFEDSPVAAPPAPVVDESSSSLDSATLQLGSSGTHVSALQRVLTSKGFYVYVDGDFGATTKSAVMQYQRSVGLYVDGIVGPTTQTSLDGSSAAAPAPPKDTSYSGTGDDSIVNTAYKYLGIPYVWGGSTPAGFDCSGLTQYVYAKNGISIPRGARAQLYSGTDRSASTAKPGDLVGRHDGNHIGIYLGNNKKIHASTFNVPSQVAPLSTRDLKFTTYR